MMERRVFYIRGGHAEMTVASAQGGQVLKMDKEVSWGQKVTNQGKTMLVTALLQDFGF